MFGYILPALLITGLGGITAQIILLRELLVNFYGNELTIGTILASWGLWEAAGALFIGRGKAENDPDLFFILQAVFSAALPASIYLARIAKEISGIHPGEGVGIIFIFLASMACLSLPAFSHGALFSLSCRIYSRGKKEDPGPSGRPYAYETIGTLLGGVIFTFFLINRFNPFQSAFIIAFLNLGLCIAFFNFLSRPARWGIVSFFCLVLALVFFNGIGFLQRDSLARQWKHRPVLESRNSPHGNITVTQEGRQRTFYYNGLPEITQPFPDMVFLQEFAHLPLLFHANPQKLFILGGAPGGLLEQILRHPIKEAVAAEPDPLMIEMLRKYPSEITARELSDPRSKIINTDGRFYLFNTRESFDLILVGISGSADLSSNRMFTREFFRHSRTKLKRGGVLAFWLPGSEVYLGGYLRDINQAVLRSLKNAYPYIRVIPGDYNIFLASEDKKITELTANEILSRIEERGLNGTILTGDYLAYRMEKKRERWFADSLAGSRAGENRDLRPLAVFLTLALWNREFSGEAFNFLKGAAGLNLTAVLLVIVLLSAAVIPLRKRLAISWGIFTTGFFGMMASLILIFSFQVFCGYLYYAIGILTAVFMAGAAAGSLLSVKVKKDPRRAFIFTESSIVIFSLAAAYILNILSDPKIISAWIVCGSLLFLAGFFTGQEFPLACRLRKGIDTAKIVGRTYFLDLLGGCIAALLGSFLLIPVLGVFNSCLALAALKLGSLLIIASTDSG